MRQNPGAHAECPAIAEIADAIEATYPNIVLFTTNNVSPATRHTIGLAIDIMLDVTKTDKRTLAHGMIDVFCRNHGAMKWSDICYSDYAGGQISYWHWPGGAGYGGPNGMLKRNPYTQDTRHGDHIHLDYVDWSLKTSGTEFLTNPYKWSNAANTTGFGSALKAQLAAIPTTPAPPAPSAALPAWSVGWWQVMWEGTPYFYLFQANGQAAYTKVRPAGKPAQIANPQDRGAAQPSGQGIAVRWNITGSVETFTPQGNGSLLGRNSNYSGQMTASRF